MRADLTVSRDNSESAPERRADKPLPTGTGGTGATPIRSHLTPDEATTVTSVLDGSVDLARDRDLVERCQTGDDRSFEELYSRYNRRLFRFCLRRLHVVDDAEDAVQEAFSRAWRAMPSFAGERHFYPWLSVIARNVCTDVLRRRARMVTMDEPPQGGVVSEDRDVDERLIRAADLAMATEAFAHLSARHQRVLRLRETTGWTAQHIAQAEGLPVPAVDTLLWRAREALKREFALISESGGLAGVFGISFAALRRATGRAWLRIAPYVPGPVRAPGKVAAVVAIVVGASTAGSVALVTNGPAHPGPGSVHAPSQSPPTVTPAAGTSATTPRGTSTSAGSVSRSVSGTRAGRGAPGSAGTPRGLSDAAATQGSAATRSTTAPATVVLPGTGLSLNTGQATTPTLGIGSVFATTSSGATRGVGGITSGAVGDVASGATAGAVGGVVAPTTGGVVTPTTGGVVSGAPTGLRSSLSPPATTGMATATGAPATALRSEAGGATVAPNANRTLGTAADTVPLATTAGDGAPLGS